MNTKNSLELPEALITRDNFRESVFKRDNYQCVICKAPAKDAHHIIERRLFDDGGYYIENGASLCELHHIQAEETTLSCEDIRNAAGTKKIILPDHYYDNNNYRYDKWGNIILPTGQRLKGELFYDESVQKILKQGGFLNNFSTYIKYPRTLHLPWSERITKDDRVLKSLDQFKDKTVVVTEKLDGENTSMYRDYIHARSIDSGNHPSRSMVKRIWAKISYDIPEGYRICGENMYAVHSIQYNDLVSYFYVFSIWNEKNECLSWKDTCEYSTLLGLNTVPVLYCGLWDEKVLNELRCSGTEGYVVRTANLFQYKDFRKNVAKFVSNEFQINHGHWSKKQIIPNKLRG